MARSAGSELQSASFMIFQLWNFTSNLSIPRKFATKYRQAVDQASVMLKTFDSEIFWEVKIKNINGDYYMKDGWPKFMKDNHIQDSDFLTFRLLSQSTFEVTIYRSDGCTRLLTSPTLTTSADVNVRVRVRGRGRGRGRPPGQWSNPLYFEICLKEYQYSRICLPKEFTKAANMKEKTYVRMKYVGTATTAKQNNKKKNWEHVVVDYRRESYRVDLAKGWTQFRNANKLVCGKVYSFEFIPNKNIIHVKEVD